MLLLVISSVSGDVARRASVLFNVWFAAVLLVLAGVICCVGLRCLSCVGCCAVRRPLMAAGCVLCCLFLVASPLFASTLIFVCRGLSRDIRCGCVMCFRLGVYRLLCLVGLMLPTFCSLFVGIICIGVPRIGWYLFSCWVVIITRSLFCCVMVGDIGRCISLLVVGYG